MPSSLEVFTDELGSTRYHGMLVNNTSGTLDHSSVYAFGLTAAGRPLFGVYDTNLDDIAGFGSWAFETSRVETAAWRSRGSSRSLR